MTKILYFVADIVINNNKKINVHKLDEQQLLQISDLVIKNNFIIKDRQVELGKLVTVTDADIFDEMKSFEGIVVVRTEKTINPAATEIKSCADRYMKITTEQLNPLLDKMAARLQEIYIISDNHSQDWALEFINCSNDYDYVFGRLNSLFKLKNNNSQTKEDEFF